MGRIGQRLVTLPSLRAKLRVKLRVKLRAKLALCPGAPDPSQFFTRAPLTPRT